MSQYDNTIGKTADQIREMAEVSTIPFDAFEIAKKLNIKVDDDPTPERLDYAGSITKHSNGSVSIWVNPDDVVARQNFTVAHEIGHLVNGDLKAVDIESVEFRDTDSTLYRDKGKNEKEWKANEFAAELLMPKELITKEVSKLLGNRGVADFDELAPILAKKFGVSKSAIRVRLRILGLLE